MKTTIQNDGQLQDHRQTDRRTRNVYFRPNALRQNQSSSKRSPSPDPEPGGPRTDFRTSDDTRDEARAGRMNVCCLKPLRRGSSLLIRTRMTVPQKAPLWTHVETSGPKEAPSRTAYEGKTRCFLLWTH